MTIPCYYCKRPIAVPEQQGRSGYECPSCFKIGTILLTKVRAKNSKGARSYNIRDYSIRVKHGSTEELVQFRGDYDKFEIRQGDSAAFVYDGKDRLRSVYNLNIGANMKVPQTNKWIAYAIALVAIIAAGLAVSIVLTALGGR